jgi:hypothetical protein
VFFELWHRDVRHTTNEQFQLIFIEIFQGPMRNNGVKPLGKGLQLQGPRLRKGRLIEKVQTVTSQQCQISLLVRVRNCYLVAIGNESNGFEEFAFAVVQLLCEAEVQTTLCLISLAYTD